MQATLRKINMATRGVSRDENDLLLGSSSSVAAAGTEKTWRQQVEVATTRAVSRNGVKRGPNVLDLDIALDPGGHIRCNNYAEESPLDIDIGRRRMSALSSVSAPPLPPEGMMPNSLTMDNWLSEDQPSDCDSSSLMPDAGSMPDNQELKDIDDGERMSIIGTKMMDSSSSSRRP
jgi:hypothetical protein